MTNKIEEDRPPLDSRVRAKGDPHGQIMTVLNPALGEQHDWEGVRNGIYCVWYVNGEERFEVYRPGQLVVVEDPPDTHKQQ